MIELILGIGVIAFIFIYLAVSLDDEHFILKLLLFLSVFTLLIFIPKVNLDQECFPVVINSSMDADNTTYTWGEHCLAGTTASTPTDFHRWYMRIYYVFWIYIFIFAFWKIYSNWNEWFSKVEGKLRKWGGRKR